MTKKEEEMARIAMDIISESFGIGKPGTHKKECPICGCVFEEPNDLDVLIDKGPSKCPFCSNIEALKLLIDEYEFGNFNLIKKEKDTEYKFWYGIENQAKEIKSHGETLPAFWRQLTVDIDGNLEIFESIHYKKQSFWDDGKNLKFYIIKTTLYFIVMRLVELVKKCKTILNVINNHKKDILSQKIHLLAAKKDGKITFNEIIPIIHFDKTVSLIEDIFKDLEPICNDLKGLRDKAIAHMDNSFSPDFLKSASFNNMRRVQNALKNICSAYFLILAPQLYNPTFENHGIDLDKMDRISKAWHSLNNTKN